ncbi:hypothetical protein LEP1GSC005_2998 [Leptospira santarosai str. ST188]|nr:hypothetical protein [Leptospira santarosai]OLY60299.1 hypothetical protein BV917_10995 [Leptospira santarosai serovar Guaricura]OLY63915.1 hypothetical protein BWD11_11745 [Leptospira santarosai serovar Grippotyphosa]ONF76604.1 hypothetical protein BWD12_18065 [Leptospira santarosai serovar Bananal]ASV10687.1 hypothetical protein B2G51_01580 [Leptospira santarosai]EMF90192.1 hypothetical protein LEP1GSC005_2998 [Leptospira santarosai str. ST188]
MFNNNKCIYKGHKSQRDVICRNSYVFSKVIEGPISFKVLRRAPRRRNLWELPHFQVLNLK